MALIGFTTIASSFRLVRVLSFGEDTIVMRLHDAGHIGQTAIGNLYSAAIEYLVQLGTLWKMLVDRLQKSLTDVGLNTLAIWWVKPYHFS